MCGATLAEQRPGEENQDNIMLLLAPNNEALLAGLEALNLASAQFSEDDTDLIGSLTELHWAGAAGEGADVAITASGNTLAFEIDGTASTLEQVLAAGPIGVSIKGPTNTIAISDIISCKNLANEPQVLFVVDNILLPGPSELAPVAPDQAPETDLTSAGFVANALLSFTALALSQMM